FANPRLRRHERRQGKVGRPCKSRKGSRATFSYDVGAVPTENAKTQRRKERQILRVRVRIRTPTPPALAVLASWRLGVFCLRAGRLAEEARAGRGEPYRGAVDRDQGIALVVAAAGRGRRVRVQRPGLAVEVSDVGSRGPHRGAAHSP